MLHRKWRPLIVVGGLAAAGYLALRYRHEKQRALQTLQAGSQLAQLASGTLEYATQGQGPPVLIMHGGGGGYEQGLWLGQILALDDYQIIAPSRPGHRRTPTATGRTPAAQAQAMCALLDQLGVESAFVVGLSAGGLSALQFAIDHADRCRGLVLISAQAPALAVFQPARYWLWLLSLMISSDLLMWFIVRLGIGELLIRLQDDTHHDSNFGPLLQNMFPVSDLHAGTINDLDNVLAQTPMALEAIRVPTLLLHGKRDVTVPYAVAVDTAQRIPRAELMTIPDGTHFMIVGKRDVISAAVKGFMTSCLGGTAG